MKIRMLFVAAFVSLAGCAGTGGDPPEVGGVVRSETGLASFYGHQYHGRTTANGEVYDEGKLTAAHRTLAFGTRVQVTNLANQRSVVLRINDRGPFVAGRVIDVSFRAAQELNFVQAGLVKVRVDVLPGG